MQSKLVIDFLDLFLRLLERRPKPGVIRVVLDLKTDVKPQMFNLKPVAEYGHRLVLDVYPLQPVDPIIALLQSTGVTIHTESPGNASMPESTTPAIPENNAAVATVQESTANPREASTDRTATHVKQDRKGRILIIAVDAGHGGEDPGAHGRGGQQWPGSSGRR